MGSVIQPPCPESSSPEPLPAGPLTLEQLIALALANHPDLAVAHARVEMARGLFIQAGLYPNPGIGWMGEEIGNRENAAGFEGPMLTQTIILGGKLKLAQAAAAYGITVANWDAITRRYALVTRVRLAFYERLTAERELQANDELVSLAEQTLETAKAAERAGTGARPDVIRAEIELNQSRIRRGVAEQRAKAARRQLAITVGRPELAEVPVAGSLEDPHPRYAWESTLPTVLMRSSEVQSAQAAILQAQRKVRREQAEVIPNLSLQIAPVYDFTEDVQELNFQATFNVPLFDKNQGNILNAAAEAGSFSAEARRVELSLQERLTAAFQRYRAASQQVELYEKEILPKAAESLRLVQIGYRAGDAKFDYTTVLQAQQTLAQARLAYIQAYGEFWRGVVDIAGLLQQEHLEALDPSKP